jgi:hypothetical protein
MRQAVARIGRKSVGNRTQSVRNRSQIGQESVRNRSRIGRKIVSKSAGCGVPLPRRNPWFGADVPAPGAPPLAGRPHHPPLGPRPHRGRRRHGFPRSHGPKEDANASWLTAGYHRQPALDRSAPVTRGRPPCDAAPAPTTAHRKTRQTQKPQDPWRFARGMERTNLEALPPGSGSSPAPSPCPPRLCHAHRACPPPTVPVPCPPCLPTRRPCPSGASSATDSHGRTDHPNARLTRHGYHSVTLSSSRRPRRRWTRSVIARECQRTPRPAEIRQIRDQRCRARPHLPRRRPERGRPRASGSGWASNHAAAAAGM